jgi:hypothetical protein
MEKQPESVGAGAQSAAPAARKPAPAKSNFDNFDDDIPF